MVICQTKGIGVLWWNGNDDVLSIVMVNHVFVMVMVEFALFVDLYKSLLSSLAVLGFGFDGHCPIEPCVSVNWPHFYQTGSA